MKRYGFRCDLLVEAENEEQLDEIMTGLEIKLLDKNGQEHSKEKVELLVGDGGARYAIKEDHKGNFVLIGEA